jgi:hypothetical protein
MIFEIDPWDCDSKEAGARKIYLHAQSAVVGFYEFVEFRCVRPISVQRALLIERWCQMISGKSP